MTPKEGDMQKTGKARASQEVREARFRDIEALLDKGLRPANIVRAISFRYGKSIRQVERDIRFVKRRRAECLLLASPDELQAEHYTLGSHIYHESLNVGDYKTALKALALQQKIVESYSSNGGHNHATESDTFPTTPAELEAILGALETEWTGE